MRSIRKLYFRNAAGERFGLNGEKGVYATGISGLGFTLTPTYADLGRGFFVPVSDEAEPQGAVPFTVVFTRNPYQTYQAFVNWLTAAGTVTVVYNPTGTQEYYRDVTINFIQKGELNAVGWLEVPCSFFCNTPWYLPRPTSLTLEATGTDESKSLDDVRIGQHVFPCFYVTPAVQGIVTSEKEKPLAREQFKYTDMTEYFYKNLEEHRVVIHGSTYAIATPEEAAVISEYSTTLSTYCGELLTDLILGRKSLDDLDTYIEEMNELGMQEYLAARQAQRDRAVGK